MNGFWDIIKKWTPFWQFVMFAMVLHALSQVAIALVDFMGVVVAGK